MMEMDIMSRCGDYMKLEETMANICKEGIHAEQAGDAQNACILFEKSLQIFQSIKNLHEYQEHKAKWDKRVAVILRKIDHLSNQLKSTDKKLDTSKGDQIKRSTTFILPRPVDHSKGESGSVERSNNDCQSFNKTPMVTRNQHVLTKGNTTISPTTHKCAPTVSNPALTPFVPPGTTLRSFHRMSITNSKKVFTSQTTNEMITALIPQKIRKTLSNSDPYFMYQNEHQLKRETHIVRLPDRSDEDGGSPQQPAAHFVHRLTPTLISPRSTRVNEAWKATSKSSTPRRLQVNNRSVSINNRRMQQTNWKSSTNTNRIPDSSSQDSRSASRTQQSGMEDLILSMGKQCAVVNV